MEQFLGKLVLDKLEQIRKEAEQEYGEDVTIEIVALSTFYSASWGVRVFVWDKPGDLDSDSKRNIEKTLIVDEDMPPSIDRIKQLVKQAIEQEVKFG